MEDSKEEVMVENGGMSGSLDLKEVINGFYAFDCDPTGNILMWWLES